MFGLGRPYRAAVLIVATLALTRSAAAGRGVVIESVNNYNSSNCTPDNGCTSCCGSCGFPDLCNSIANSDGFLGQLPASLFAQQARFVNNGVWDSDFCDPERGFTFPCNDTNNFDQHGVAISYFTGHGRGALEGIPAPGTYVCHSTAECNSMTPPAGSTFPTSCVAQPDRPLGEGRCYFATVTALYTHSTNDSNGGQVNLGGSWYNAVRFGESNFTGTWAGAGANGGANLIVLDGSWMSLPGLQGISLLPLIAGAHMVAATQPTWGDTSNVVDRGAAFAHRAAAHPTDEAVFVSWTSATMADLPPNDGSQCPGGGGFQGFNGCGCNVIVTQDSTQAAAIAHTAETWSQVKKDITDVRGSGWWYWSANCNYSTNLYPWSL